MPVFMESMKDDPDHGWGISRAVITWLAWLFAILGVLILIFAPFLVHLLVGRGMQSEHQQTTIFLMRLLSMNMMLFAVSNVFAGVLQSYKRFVAVSIAPILYKAGILLAILFFGHQYGPVSVAYGAIAGALMHLGIQFTAAWRAGWRFGRIVSWRDGAVRKIGRLILPRTVGQSVTQFDQFVNVPIATRLGEGQLTIFRMANDIQDAPVSIIGLSMATVSFPVFVELLSQGKIKEFIEHFSRIVRQVLFLIIPLTILIIQLRAQIVRIFYGAPSVSWEVTISAAQTLGYFALSFVAQSLIPILARSFYAMKDTKTPVRITIIAVGLDIVGSVVLGFTMGVQGLALSYTISSLINAGALMVILHRRLGTLDEGKIINAVARIAGTTILMAVTVQMTKVALVSLGVSLTHAYGVLIQLVVASAVGVMAYLVFSIIFRIEEVNAIGSFIRRSIGGNKNGHPA
jgi:putative peptidoglycan lipid II flippase